MRPLLLISVAMFGAACGGGGITTTQPGSETAENELGIGWSLYSCERAEQRSCSDHRPSLSQRYFSVQDESSLCDIVGGDVEAYRLTWSRTFENPVMSRVQRQGKTLTWRVLRDGAVEGYDSPDAGVLQEDRSGPLAEKEWDRVVAVIDAASFWTLPEESVQGGAQYSGDGGTWLLEGRRGDEYVGADCRLDLDAASARVQSVGRVLLDVTGMLPENEWEVN